MQKPQAFYRKMLWDVSPIEMLAHAPMAAGATERVSGWGWQDERDSWNWPDGGTHTVRVFSKCANHSAAVLPTDNITGAVELLLNGKPVSGSPAPIGPATQFIATFQVPFQKGTLQARSVDLLIGPLDLEMLIPLRQSEMAHRACDALRCLTPLHRPMSALRGPWPPSRGRLALAVAAVMGGGRLTGGRKRL